MAPETSPSLTWGLRYAMVRPDHFRVEYQINPYMSPDNPPNARVASEQWGALVTTLRRLGAVVDVLDGRPDAPDMVYAMNLGLAVSGTAGPGMVMSHMRYPQRRMETASAAEFFTDAGFATSYVGGDGIGAHFEAGDAFPYAGRLLLGHGPRTDLLAAKHLATLLDVPVEPVRISHPGMYHLDLAFCPLDARHALVCPAALDDASADRLLRLVPEPLVLSEAEALTFCANSVVVGRTVVMPACPPRVRAALEAWGFRVELVDVSEFHKGGGSIRCLTNPLDIVAGRDLDHVPGGSVRLPS